MPEDKKNSADGAEVKIVKLGWRWSAVPPTVYANQLIVSHAGPEFYLHFGEFVPPVQPSGSLELKEAEVVPVATVAVSSESMLRMVDALQKNVERYRARLQKEQDQDQDDDDTN